MCGPEMTAEAAPAPAPPPAPLLLPPPPPPVPAAPPPPRTQHGTPRALRSTEASTSGAMGSGDVWEGRDPHHGTRLLGVKAPDPGRTIHGPHSVNATARLLPATDGAARCNSVHQLPHKRHVCGKHRRRPCHPRVAAADLLQRLRRKRRQRRVATIVPRRLLQRHPWYRDRRRASQAVAELSQHEGLWHDTRRHHTQKMQQR